MNAKNASTAKPKTGGAVYRAPIGTTLPTDATSALDNAFEELGYCSEDGITEEQATDSTDTIAWGGDIIDTVNGSKTVTAKLKLMEVLNDKVIKAVYGSENVTGDLDTGLHIEVNTKDVEESSWVIDMILRGGVIMRTVIPDVKISELAEINYKHNEDYGYDLTLKALVSDGKYCDKYMVKPAATSTTETSTTEG